MTFVRPDNRATAVRALLQRAGCTILADDDLERALSTDSHVVVGPVDPEEATAPADRVARAAPRGPGSCVFLVAGEVDPGFKLRLKEFGGQVFQSPWSIRRLLKAVSP